jgi:uncharacterized protein YceK
MKKKTLVSLALVLIMLLSGCSTIIGNETSTDEPSVTQTETDTPTTDTTTRDGETTTTTQRDEETTTTTQRDEENKYPAGINETGVYNYTKLYNNHISSLQADSFAYRRLTDTEDGDSDYRQTLYNAEMIIVSDNETGFALREVYFDVQDSRRTDTVYLPGGEKKYQKQVGNNYSNMTVYRTVSQKNKADQLAELAMVSAVRGFAPRFDLKITAERDDGTIVLSDTKSTDINWLSKYSDVESPQNARLSLRVRESGFVEVSYLYVEGENVNVTIREQLATGNVTISPVDWLDELRNQTQQYNTQVDPTGSYVELEYIQGHTADKSRVTIATESQRFSKVTNTTLSQQNRYYVVVTEDGQTKLLTEEPDTEKYDLPETEQIELQILGAYDVTLVSEDIDTNTTG